MAQFVPNIRLYSVIGLICLLLLTVPLISHHLLSDEEKRQPSADGAPDFLSVDAVRKTLGLIEFDTLSGPEIKSRVEELLRIKRSVQNELSRLEAQRSEMQKQAAALEHKIDDLKSQANREQADLERLRLSINQAELLQRELAQRNTPEILPPIKLMSLPDNNYITDGERWNADSCTWSNCFDLSRCPLSSGFPVYFYSDTLKGLWSSQAGLELGLGSASPDEACLFVAGLDFCRATPSSLFALPFWRGDGRNHLIIDTSSGSSSMRRQPCDSFLRAKAILASSSFNRLNSKYDQVLPPISRGLSESELWTEMMPIFPLRRQYLLLYVGSGSSANSSIYQLSVLPYLSSINNDQTDDRILLDGRGNRTQMQTATFGLFMASERDGPELRKAVHEMLREACVPVVLCISDCRVIRDHLLPFSELVDYQKVLLLVPLARVPELHFLLRSIPDSDLFYLKRQGRLVWQNYWANNQVVITALLNLIRSSIGLPAPAMKSHLAHLIFNDTHRPLTVVQPAAEAETSEFLGAVEAPRPSVAFRRNFSSMLVNGYDMWNTFFSSSQMAPYTPWEPLLPTEAKFLGSGMSFRPIGNGEGGAGKEFSQSIGGNMPYEQFTIVMLTYEREQVLMESLARLFGLPYLNKVVVVCNSPIPPNDALPWPDIGVPIEVVRTDKNSLNNRFVPYDVIETEAILSVDDDAHLRHDEIIFGFRVWRENRDRLVGFPGRFHAWDAEHRSWNYNSNYSCELSMVLTGAAFHHKFYSYVYTNLMPRAIRDKVDEFMNCEDLAMNFLISHITRKPPVKVTSRWTFRCPGCPVSLSEEDSHYEKRHRCINFFVQVYGYNPLLYTQFRADSILFKTRIPSDKSKCFKFI